RGPGGPRSAPLAPARAALSDAIEIDWEGEDGLKLAQLRNAFLARSESGHPGPTADYWECERDLELYDATLGARIGWRWEWVLDEARFAGAQRARTPARTVVDLGCGSGVAARAALEAGWIADDASVTCVDRSALARYHAAARLRGLGPGLTVRTAPSAPQAPELLLIGHLLLELSDAAFDDLLQTVRAAETTVWVEPGTHTAGRRLSLAHEALRPDRRAVAPCPHARRCGLLAEGRERDWCHHFPEPPAEAFTESLPGRVAQELGIDLRSLATSYLVLEPSPPERAPELGRILGRPKIEKGRARVDLCRATGVDRVDLAKRADAALWRAWKRPGRERLLYRVEVEGHRLERATPIDDA
ncbi:MAG: class I SAM-dependent methyltransferase, partial [Planctomycetota bacterium]